MSTLPTPFDKFCDSLAQLQQDQSLFESKLGQEFDRLLFDDLISLGDELCQSLLLFAKKCKGFGPSFVDSLPPNFFEVLILAIHDYQSLLLPPKRFYGVFSCLKPKHHGPKFERSLAKVKILSSTAIFMSLALIVEFKSERYLTASVDSADMAFKNSELFDRVAAIKCDGNDKSRRKAALSLYTTSQAVIDFVESKFGLLDTDSRRFRNEAVSRVKKGMALLTSSNKQNNGEDSPGSRSASASSRRFDDSVQVELLHTRDLIKVQSGLQEILNSIANRTLQRAKSTLFSLEKFSTRLEKSKSALTSRIDGIEQVAGAYNLTGILNATRAETGEKHREVSDNIKDAAKRWTSAKEKAKPRPVAVYKEEIDIMNMPNNGPLFSGVDNINIGKAGKDAIKSAGGLINNIASDTKEMFSDVIPSGPKGGIKPSFSKGFDAVKGFATEVGHKAKEVGKKVESGVNKIIDQIDELENPKGQPQSSPFALPSLQKSAVSSAFSFS